MTVKPGLAGGDLKRGAPRRAWRLLREDGLAKVRAGMTSFDEVVRVTA